MAKRASASNVDQLRDLLLWARDKRIVFGTVVVGDVTVTVTDLGIATPTKRGRKDKESDLFAAFAGPHAAELADAGLGADDDEDGESAAVQ